jgi:hypothetical protein
MKVFLFAAMGAALLAGCAPFEHGHYANDVAYKNTVGDPAGTPLVYRGDSVSRSTSFASRNTSANTSWRRTAHHHSTPVAVQTAYAAPSYSPVATQSYAAAPAYSAPAYTAQAYAAPQQVVSQSYAAAPVIQQPYVQSAQSSTYAPASSYAATTFGSGLRFDSEGYAICDIPGAHGVSGHGVSRPYY